MKRTTTRRRREIRQFITANRRLFPFVGLFLAGVALGVVVYVTNEGLFASLPSLLRIQAIGEGFGGWWHAFCQRCFGSLGLLCLLYLLGLWACGIPFAAAVPLFYGLGLGLTEGYYYAMGAQGVLAVAVVLLPGALLTAAVLTMATTESLRLSARLSRQLLPRTPPEGLWGDFKLYCLRYLLFAAAAVGIGGLDTLLRRVAGGLLP